MRQSHMLLDGKIASEHYLNILKEKVSKFSFIPKLTVIQVGNNPASNIYINIKKKTLTKIGIDFEHINLPEDIKSDDVAKLIHDLNVDKSITGILLQLPLPSHLDPRVLTDIISPEKDVDCLTTYNLGQFFVGNSELLPATPQGVLRLMEYYKIDIESKNICVIGKSNLVGKPLAVALSNKDATVTICHILTKDIQEFTKNADIVITAAGQPKFFTKDYFREGQTVIDIGITKAEDGNIYGDVDFENVKDIVKNITPVPGGVGPMTVYALAENLIELNNSTTI